MSRAIPDVCMRDIIATNSNPDLDTSLKSDLPFKIAVTDQKWVDQFPAALCLGRTEYDYNVDTWLARSCFFSSETAVTSLDQMWVNILSTCMGGVVIYLNQHDPSSAIRRRPDTTLLRQGALVLKGEAKNDPADMESAKEQLVNSFFPGAYRLFPRVSRAVVGVTSCSTCASIYIMQWINGKFSIALHRHYNLQAVVSERLAFMVDVFKVARWMVTVTAPVSSFHMIPSMRRKTRNGHHVTWCNDGILKEYKQPRANVISRILDVYGHRLPHVEWGHAVVDNPNAIMITRVGVLLKDALATGDITRAIAVEHVRLGMTELHDKGFAHCDIVVDNVFVDNGIAFLDDLEYLTPVECSAPVNARWDRDRHPDGLTAKGLDLLLMASFAVEVLRS